MSDYKKILCVDFDGVLHSYTSGWKGANIIEDDPVPGAMNWLLDMLHSDEYEIHIYSSRSSQKGGVQAMKQWIAAHIENVLFATTVEFAMANLYFPTKKPPAYLTIDDRAICFRGTFPSINELDNFKPWNR